MFDPILINLVQKSDPEIIAKELCSVQDMTVDSPIWKDAILNQMLENFIMRLCK